MSCQGRGPASSLTPATLNCPYLPSAPHRECPDDGNASHSDFISIHRKIRKRGSDKRPHYGTNTPGNDKGQTSIAVVLSWKDSVRIRVHRSKPSHKTCFSLIFILRFEMNTLGRSSQYAALFVLILLPGAEANLHR